MDKFYNLKSRLPRVADWARAERMVMSVPEICIWDRIGCFIRRIFG